MAAPIGHAQLSGSQVPQHATFAHSKEDVLNALAFYFGQVCYYEINSSAFPGHMM